MYQLTHHLRPLAIAFVAGSLLAATPAFAGGVVKNGGGTSRVAGGTIFWAATHDNDVNSHEISHVSARHGKGMSRSMGTRRAALPALSR